jgi:nicotinate-nucleotide adenylyltransferase
MSNLPANTGSNIGLLGGSFDPPHLGHSLLALSFLALEPIDELWIIPCQNHAFKGCLNSFEQRFDMCKLAFSRINNIRVLDLENSIDPPNYTIKTLDLILSKRPDLNLFFAIGSDLITDFSKWHKPEEILKKTSVVIFERQNYPIKLTPILKNARIHQGYCLPDTNSTEIRASILRDSSTHTFVDQKVREYINQNKLYRAF